MIKSLAVGDEGSILTPVLTVAEVVVVLVVAVVIGTRCSSPEQHMREAVNFIGRLGGRYAPCLERLTLTSEVTMRLNVGLPVPVYR